MLWQLQTQLMPIRSTRSSECSRHHDDTDPFSRSLRSRAVVFAALIVGFPLLILAAQSQPPARSQGSEHRVRVALYHSVIEWPAPPGDFGAHVTVADSIGEKADGTGSSGPDGIIRVQLRINRGGRGEPWPDHHLAPGDRVSLERSDGVTVSLILPELSADVTDDGLTIVGTAPPSAALSLYQEPVPSGLPAPPAVDITAGPDGRFEHVLAPEHARTPGTGGYVEYSNADGDFTAHFASREVAIVLDSTRVEHRRTLQTVLKITRPVTLSGGKRVLRSITGSRAPTTVGPDGRGVLDDLPKYPLVAGLPVTVSLTGGPLGRSDDTRLTLPDLRVVFDGAARMSGNGPAEVPLRLDLFAPDQPSPSFTVEVRPEADGTFIAEIAGAGPDNSWLARNTLDGLRTRRGGAFMGGQAEDSHGGRHRIAARGRNALEARDRYFAQRSRGNSRV